jgi:hypothetical protein
MATRSKELKATNIGSSKTVFALMIKVEHTNAPTITLTARKDLELMAATIDTRKGKKVKDAPVHVLAGTLLVLVASSISGYYYIGRVSAGGAVGCTCPHHQNRHSCKHQDSIRARHEARVSRNVPGTDTEMSPNCPVDEVVLPQTDDEPLEDEAFSEELAPVWTEQELAAIRGAA